MHNVIFIDLDGTILDGKCKHYQCYKEIVKVNGKPLNKEVYWKLKRGKVNLDNILEMSEYRYDKNIFIKEWIEKIEDINFLKYDRLKPNVKRTLKMFKINDFKLILVTMRRNKENLIKQLKQLDIMEYFDEVLCCEYKKIPKYEMIKNINYDNAIFIGDTEEDINTAKYLNIKSIAILNGLRDKKFLEEADYFFNEIKDININVLL